MNRRNFILGLGTAATLSGAASVTGAALNDTVTPTADFRVIAQENLEVRKNQQGLDESTDENFTNVEPTNFGDEEFNETAGASSPNMSVTDGISNSNEDLSINLATPNDATKSFNNNGSSDGPKQGDLPYVNQTAVSGTSLPDGIGSGEGGEAPLEIFNPTGVSQEVAVSFGYGDDVNSGPVSESTVDELFRFYTLDAGGSGETELISPAGTSSPPTTGEGANVAAGEAQLVHMTINMDSSIQSELQDAASAEGSAGFDTGAADSIELLNTVEFGVVE